MLCTHVTQTRERAKDYVGMRSISTEEPNEEIENRRKTFSFIFPVLCPKARENSLFPKV